jgi:speckle-type POZ protein
VSRILDHMFQSGASANVSFKVKDETIPAHRNILAARSSVFHAELFGSMRESKEGYCIEIEDMEPEVCKALHHFLYTNVLVVTADWYGLDRLPLICKDKLVKGIGTDNVVTTLALAVRHNCPNLRGIYMSGIYFFWYSSQSHTVIEIDVFNGKLSIHL